MKNGWSCEFFFYFWVMHPLFLIIFDCFQQSVFSVHCLMKWVLDPFLSPRILSPVSPWAKLVSRHEDFQELFSWADAPLAISFSLFFCMRIFAKSDCSKVTSISSLVSLCSGVNCKKSPVASAFAMLCKNWRTFNFYFHGWCTPS